MPSIYNFNLQLISGSPPQIPDLLPSNDRLYFRNSNNSKFSKRIKGHYLHTNTSIIFT